MLLVGDFNATTAVSQQQSFFDGKNIVEEPICNDNGQRIKNFCREKQVCMVQTYFNHPIEERYTWISPNKKTKKVLDYILAEPYLLNFTNECYVNQNLNFDTDHHIVITVIALPLTKSARKIFKKSKNYTKLDEKALKINTIKSNFVNEISKGVLAKRQEEQSKTPKIYWE